MITANAGNHKQKPEPRVFLKGVHVLQALGGILLILNIVLLYAILFSSKGILGYRQQSQQVAELNAKVRKLREENHRLFRRIQNFKNDPHAQERLIREKLGWTRDDELVIEFIPSKDAPPAQP
jgi:cell division protein FtsB